MTMLLLLGGPIGRAMIPFAALMGLFWTLESLWPEDRTQPKWRRDSLTDVLYWFLAYGVRLVATVAVLITIAFTTRVLPHAGLGQTRSQPVWLQALEILFVGDLIEYWMHRFFHRNPVLWPIHAVHHSPQQLDWLAAARVHPLDTIITRVAVVLPLYLLGFSGQGLAPYAVFLAIYPIYLHANISWTYGPFRYVLAGPAFHRWHHSSEKAALDKNFSALFPFLDLLFGTAYFPERPSARYGLYQERMPGGIIRQCLYPLRTLSPRALIAARRPPPSPGRHRCTW